MRALFEPEALQIKERLSLTTDRLEEALCEAAFGREKSWAARVSRTLQEVEEALGTALAASDWVEQTSPDRRREHQAAWELGCSLRRYAQTVAHSACFPLPTEYNREPGAVDPGLRNDIIGIRHKCGSFLEVLRRQQKEGPLSR